MRTLVQVREVVHLVPLNASPEVADVVTRLLAGCDRGKWYPSMVVEGEGSTSEQARLAQAARLLGVPVMSTRSPRGEPAWDALRSFLDDWFYVRNTQASLLHLHLGPQRSRWAPSNWLRVVMPRLPVVTFAYAATGLELDTASIEILVPGMRNRDRVSATSATDTVFVSKLYDTALEASGAR